MTLLCSTVEIVFEEMIRRSAAQGKPIQQQFSKTGVNKAIIKKQAKAIAGLTALFLAVGFVAVNHLTPPLTNKAPNAPYQIERSISEKEIPLPRIVEVAENQIPDLIDARSVLRQNSVLQSPPSLISDYLPLSTEVIALMGDRFTEESTSVRNMKTMVWTVKNSVQAVNFEQYSALAGLISLGAINELEDHIDTLLDGQTLYATSAFRPLITIYAMMSLVNSTEDKTVRRLARYYLQASEADLPHYEAMSARAEWIKKEQDTLTHRHPLFKPVEHGSRTTYPISAILVHMNENRAAKDDFVITHNAIMSELVKDLAALKDPYFTVLADITSSYPLGYNESGERLIDWFNAAASAQHLFNEQLGIVESMRAIVEPINKTSHELIFTRRVQEALLLKYGDLYHESLPSDSDQLRVLKDAVNFLLGRTPEELGIDGVIAQAAFNHLDEAMQDVYPTPFDTPIAARPSP